jgi:hypothetical protein
MTDLRGGNKQANKQKRAIVLTWNPIIPPSSYLDNELKSPSFESFGANQMR